jgi:hypothetical protein
VPKDLVRYREVRVADTQNDQQDAAQVAAAASLSVTQEDFQNYVLSQLKRIIHGDASGHWNDDFVASEIPPLSSALDASTHEVLRQLIHFIDEGPGGGFASGAYKVVTGTPWPSAVTWWVDNSMTQKIVEQLITRNSNQAATLITWNVYATDGVTIAESLTDTITLDSSGVFELARTRAIT